MMADLPYTNTAEFEAWAEKERQRLQFEADAAAIRALTDEQLLARVVWEGDPVAVHAGNRGVGVRLAVSKHDPDWYEQVCRVLKDQHGYRLHFPIGDHIAMLVEHDGEVSLTFPTEAMGLMLETHNLRISLQATDHQLAASRRTLERKQENRDAFAALLGDHLVTDPVLPVSQTNT